MTINEAIALINTENITRNTAISRWADLGCGDGLFTMALSRLLADRSIIHGIDKTSVLKHQITRTGVEIIPGKFDFVNDDLALQHLDGILMANSLHYVKDKLPFIRKIKTYLNPGALFLVVEYDTDTPAARWVPYPLSFLSLTKLFKSAGYAHIQKLGERPSVYGKKNMYSALICK